MSALGRSRRRTGPATDRGLDSHAGNSLSSLFAHGQEQDLPGSLAIHPVTLRRSTTPDDPLRLAISGASGAAPTRLTMKASSFTDFEAARRFITCCLRFTTRVTARHARLASGGGLRLCRAGVKPAGSLREVSAHLILLPRAFPGAIIVWLSLRPETSTATRVPCRIIDRHSRGAWRLETDMVWIRVWMEYLG